MGMAAEVIAIGVYSERLAPYMRQRPLPRLGEGIAVVLFKECGLAGSSASRELARILGADPWDFSTHHLEPAIVDVDELSLLVGTLESERFDALRRCQFEFFFRPNG